MAEIPRVLTEGTYLTDGSHLVQIKRVLDDAFTVEYGPTDAPEYRVLSKADVGAKWRIVSLDDIADDDTDAWIAARFPAAAPLDTIDARRRCGCGRCMGSLEAELAANG